MANAVAAFLLLLEARTGLPCQWSKGLASKEIRCVGHQQWKVPSRGKSQRSSTGEDHQWIDWKHPSGFGDETCNSWWQGEGKVCSCLSGGASRCPNAESTFACFPLYDCWGRSSCAWKRWMAQEPHSQGWLRSCRAESLLGQGRHHGWVPQSCEAYSSLRRPAWTSSQSPSWSYSHCPGWLHRYTRGKWCSRGSPASGYHQGQNCWQLWWWGLCLVLPCTSEFRFPQRGTSPRNSRRSALWFDAAGPCQDAFFAWRGLETIFVERGWVHDHASFDAPSRGDTFGQTFELLQPACFSWFLHRRQKNCTVGKRQGLCTKIPWRCKGNQQKEREGRCDVVTANGVQGLAGDPSKDWKKMWL